jgi:hypothetical protein
MSLMVADPQVVWNDGPRRPGVVRSIRDVLSGPVQDAPAVAHAQKASAGARRETLAALAIAGLQVALLTVVRVVAPYASMTTVGLGAFVVAGFTVAPVVGWVVAGTALLLAEYAAERRR